MSEEAAQGSALETGLEPLLADLLTRAEPLPWRPEAGGQLGSYRLLAPLGRGGMGEVWAANRADGQFEQEVAIKFLQVGFSSDGLRERFRLERQILARLNHPAIAQLLDGGDTPDGSPYLVMERIRGRPLTEVFGAGLVSIEEQIRKAIEIAEVVEAAHAQLVVHRDLKPSNLLVDSRGRIRLLDFGVAKLLAETQLLQGAAAPPTHQVFLTPGYAAPEQLLGEPVTTAVDVYGLGVVLYELLTGKLPLESPDGSLLGHLVAVQKGAIPRPSEAVLGNAALGAAERRSRSQRLRGDLDRILLKALARDPQRRYRSIAEFAQDLERFLEGLPVKARPDSFAYRARRFFGRHKFESIAAILVLLSLLGGLLLVEMEARRTARQARLAERIQEFLIRLFEGASPEQARGKDLSAKELLARATQGLETELEEEPVVRSSLLSALARIERALGNPGTAERLAREALELQLRTSAADPKAIAVARMALGEALSSLGRLEEARAELEAARAAFARSGARTRPERDRAQLALAQVYIHLGRQEEAVALTEEVVRRMRSEQGPEGLEFARVLRLHGVALAALDRYAEAIAVFEEAIAILSGISGSDHPLLLMTQMNRANLIGYLGRYDEAAEEIQRLLDRGRKILGEHHPEIGQLWLELGFVEINRRRLAAARTALEAALRVFEPIDHYDVGTCFRYLGMVALSEGDFKSARTWFERAVARFREKLGPNDQLLFTALGNLGQAELELGLYAEALTHLTDSLAGLEEIYGSEAEELRYALLHLGRLCRIRGETECALQYHRRGLSLAERHLGPGHVGTARLRRELALDLMEHRRAEDLAEARTNLDLALKSLAEAAPEHPYRGEWLLDSARLASSMGDQHRAAQDGLSAVERLRAAHGAADPRVREAEQELERLLAGAGAPRSAG